VLSGAIVHLGVERIKRRGFDVSRVDVPGNLVNWAHLRRPALALSLVPVAFVALALFLFGLTVEGQEEYATYFLAGYAIDSTPGFCCRASGRPRMQPPVGSRRR